MHKIWDVKSKGNCEICANLERDYIVTLLISWQLATKSANEKECKHEYKRMKTVVQRKFLFHKEHKVNIIKIN